MPSFSAVCRRLGLCLCFALVLPGPASPSALTFLQSFRDAPVDSFSRAAVSPDGRHLYAVGDSALAVFGRDDAAGTVSLIELQPDESPGVEGLLRAAAVAVSPDGAHVYVAAREGAVAAFERDPASGALRFVDAVFRFVDVAEGLTDPLALTLSPDGRHVYVASFHGREVLTVFARDAATGTLAFVETVTAGVDGVDSLLSGAISLTLSPDGVHLYLTTVIHRLGVFRRDAATGALALVELVDLRDLSIEVGALSVAVSPDGRHVYFTTDFEVVVFAREATTGALTFVETEDDGVEAPGLGESTAVSPDGRHVYIARNLQVVAFSRDAGSGALSFAEALGLGELHGPDGPAEAADVVLAPAGDAVFVAARDAGAVSTFGRDADSGALSYSGTARIEPIDDVDGLHAAFATAVSPDGRHVYASSILEPSVILFERDGRGTLDHVETWRDDAGDLDQLFRIEDLAATPDGRWLLARGNRGIAVFERDAATGGLSFVELEREIDLGISSQAVSPDGRHVYATSDFDTGSLEVYALAPTGELDLVEIHAANPDDLHPYRVRGPVEGLLGARSVTVSPDGRHVYAAGRYRPVVFARDPDTGSLEPVAGDLVGRVGVPFLAISPDGRHLFLVRDRTREEDDLTVFERDPESGLLTPAAVFVNGQGGVEDLAGARRPVVTPDGRHVLVAGYDANALAVFERDPGSGAVRFAEAVRQGTGGNEGLAGPQTIAPSADGRSVYVASSRRSAVTAFRRECLPGPRNLCLNRGRFRAEVGWRDSAGNAGLGRVVPSGADDSGLFWFFSEDNWEMLVKVLDGCALNGRFWVYAAATTDVAYTLEVTDVHTGATASYRNSLGNAAATITDTGAFACR